MEEILYADIIVDISSENLDRTYQYAVPDDIREKVFIGSLVLIPFGRGNRVIKGYVVGLSNTLKIPEEFLKTINEVVEGALLIESQLIHLAYWIKENFGATMNDALKTVIPIKQSVKQKEKKKIRLILDSDEATDKLSEYQRKNNTARVRLLQELINENTIDYDLVIQKLNISRSTINGLVEQGIIEVLTKTVYRNPVEKKQIKEYQIVLNDCQKSIADHFINDYFNGIRKTYLIHGVTGSGKTEVYMEMIANVIANKKQVIMLIPEIALTYQTVMRFYNRFSDRISIMNSRLSKGERYDQYLRAKNGEIDIMIGPRSALFTPFSNLGLIIIDEEHEGSYKSETTPKYHAREVAIKRAEMTGASVVLGSATPSLEAYYKAIKGEYHLYTLTSRANNSLLPEVSIVDLREELKNRNKSIFSTSLREKMQDRLDKRQQIMLFINRRGYAGFVSCRSCGHVMKCNHCDVSLTYHTSGKLVCHYCNHEEVMPKVCPVCGSKYIATFGTGTQKVEEFVRKEFPRARTLRMDTDTTSTKDGHEKILTAFANHEADILIGTQMIVKGHDFPKVTLVGIIAADLSLYANDYRASERTFQLLTQAAGRAGRGSEKGEVVIQTYNPEHYSIIAASENDYEGFYQKEMLYRSAMKYPPASNILVILVSSKAENKAELCINLLSGVMREKVNREDEEESQYTIIGPTNASLSKANDIYRKIIYLKHENYDKLKDVKNYLEGYINFSEHFKLCSVQFDFNPMSSY
ncbi:replication restart helicase PriA [Anaeromicropila herbilytica]|uniref:Replication restart protein PriA n=1 Tax=Anaeromicropila herbilytica TaxID=2785025 RepID=A0A7R7EMP0_9FIRM|nr:primosomal protein N' [Anaeromicropila herbilytica]BCN31574.1 primosomal protein N' [Anaeromicropila herbilytica]